MTTRMTGVGRHPDPTELRARYEIAAGNPVLQAVDGLIVLTGLYLAISPWVVGPGAGSDLAVNNLVTGAALTVLAVGLASALGRTHGMSWVVPLIGIWTIIAPWAIYGSAAPAAATWSNVATGTVAALFGIAAMAVGVLHGGESSEEGRLSP